MTNPDNSVGTNGAFGGRTSVNAFNDGIASYSRGVLSGWACVPDSGMQVTIGGDGTTRDVAIAEDNAGNKTTINNISGAPIEVEISAAPATNSRIDAIVAYVDNPPQGDSTEVDNFSACGLIVVDGTAASTPVAPDDTAIRTAITADGASGVTAYYAVIAYVTVANGTTDIDATMIEDGQIAGINSGNIAPANSSQVSISGNRGSNSSTLQDLSGTYTLPSAGLYFVSTKVGTGTAGVTMFNISARVTCGGNAVSQTFGANSSPNYAGNNFANIALSAMFFGKKGDIVKIQTSMNNWTGLSSHETVIQQVF